MTVREAQKKIVKYILSKSGNELYEEVLWLVENTVINDDDVMDCYDYVFKED